MPPALALSFSVVIILLLLRIEHNQNPLASKALWLPTFWMLIAGSRPVAGWFLGQSTGPLSAEMIEAGSPYDRLALGILILLSLFVLVRRKTGWARFLKELRPLIIIVFFTALSILWSDFPFLSTKRWVKLIGAAIVSFVLLTESDPPNALKSVLRRCAYVLLPLSVVLIKYYPHLGREYGRWTGLVSWKGVTLQKNALGELCMVSAFFFIWELYRAWRDHFSQKTLFICAADILVLTIAIFLLVNCDSKTSALSLLVGVASMIILFRTKKDKQRIAGILILGIPLIWIFLVVGSPIIGNVTQAVGRDSSFTNRTLFWPTLIAEAKSHPLLGAGFGGYFGTPGNWLLETYGYVSAHNGLLDVVVELGAVGVLLIIVFHLALFKKCLRQFDKTIDWGVFGTCIIVISGICNYTESIFLKSTSYLWGITILLFVVISKMNLYYEKEGPVGAPKDVA